MSSDPHDDSDTLQSAHALAASGDHVQAYELVRERVARHTGEHKLHAEARTFAVIARVAERAGDHAAARRALEAALELVDWADLHFALGTSLFRDGRREGARIAYDRALAINPRYRAAAVERALLDAREGRIAEAVSALRTLAGGEGSREAEALRAGLERLREAEIEDAAPLLRRAFTGEDEPLELLVAEGEALMTAGDTAAGLAALRRAVCERPGYPDLHALLGSHELRAGQLDDGIASLVDALSLHPGFHRARLELARGLEARGERDAAIAEVQRVLEAEPGHPDATAAYERLSARRRAPVVTRDQPRVSS